jgi:NAD(P)-dependent dehydrogenase (short-subunit alcohol dehydrogenase family)
MEMAGQVRPARAALVTGGTSGIGMAIALRLASKMPVYAVSRRGPLDAADLGEAADRLGVPGPIVIAADVARRSDLVAIADQLAAWDVSLRVIVACAGTNVRRLALEVDEEEVRNLVDVNLIGTFQTFQVFAPLTLAQPNGRFIAISSVTGLHGMSLRVPYGATKAGVSGMVTGLAVEWGPFQATVNAIAPGIVETPLTSTYMSEHPDRAQAALEHTPVGRLGRAEDVAAVAAFLASEEASFVTGQTIVVDGGMSAGSSWW